MDSCPRQPRRSKGLALYFPRSRAVRNRVGWHLVENYRTARDLMQILFMVGLFSLSMAMLAMGQNSWAASSATNSQSVLRISTDFGGTVRVNSTAKLLAGLPPSYPGHFSIAETQSWKEHSAAMRSAWTQVSSVRVAAMSVWRDNAINSTCPSGKTLLYPFSGPDFFNAYWLFPDCANYVLFGLEHIGEVPEVENVSDRDLSRLLVDVRIAVSDLVDRNYFITENMSRQLRTPQLRGVIPLLIIPMALSEVEILRIVPHELPRQLRARGAHSPRNVDKPAKNPLRQLNGITIEFRKPGKSMIQRLHYFTLDATDEGLEHYPEFLTFLQSLAPTNTYLKAASYLLHGREFRRLRNTLLDVSDFLLQDDTGLPYYFLQPKRWNVQLYGRYQTPIPPFERAFQASLDKAYRASRPEPLPFEFGYSFSDKRDNRSNALIGRKLLAAQLKTVSIPKEASPATVRK
jgi:hypothetical protein